jgi:hypothetical protein
VGCASTQHPGGAWVLQVIGAMARGESAATRGATGQITAAIAGMKEMEPRKRISLREAAAFVHQMEDELAPDCPNCKRKLSRGESHAPECPTLKPHKFAISSLIWILLALVFLFLYLSRFV